MNERGKDCLDVNENGPLGQGQLLSKHRRTLTPLNSDENEDMEDGREKAEGGRYELKSHWGHSFSLNPFFSLCCSPAGRRSWHIVM